MNGKSLASGSDEGQAPVALPSADQAKATTLAFAVTAAALWQDWWHQFPSAAGACLHHHQLICHVHIKQSGQ